MPGKARRKTKKSEKRTRGGGGREPIDACVCIKGKVQARQRGSFVEAFLEKKKEFGRRRGKNEDGRPERAEGKKGKKVEDHQEGEGKGVCLFLRGMEGKKGGGKKVPSSSNEGEEGRGFQVPFQHVFTSLGGKEKKREVGPLFGSWFPKKFFDPFVPRRKKEKKRKKLPWGGEGKPS